MAMHLTDITCKTAKPGAKNYKIRDGKGLYLLVMMSGGKSWRYDYKLKTVDETHKNGTFVYGLYPEVGLGEARNLHAEAHKLVSHGWGFGCVRTTLATTTLNRTATSAIVRPSFSRIVKPCGENQMNMSSQQDNHFI